MTEDYNYQQAEVYESPAQPIKKYGFIFTEATQLNAKKKQQRSGNKCTYQLNESELRSISESDF